MEVMNQRQHALARAWVRLNNAERTAIQEAFESCEDINVVRDHLDELATSYVRLMDKFLESLKS